MKYRIVFDPGKCMRRFDPGFIEAQKWLDNEVLKDCEPYVPMRTGNLARSGQLGTKIGSGEVEYNAPYSRRVYYGTGMNFSKEKHPKATAQWFEKAKAVRRDHWFNGVQKYLKSR